jgi:purine-nucleoside phosphorylase
MTDAVTLSHSDRQAAAAYIRQRTVHRPTIGLILGSGLNPLADAVADAVRLPFAEIPHFNVTTVAGHAGRLVVGRLAGRPVILMQGRVHAYEGASQASVALPVRVMAELGVRTLVVTNAAGGVNPAYRAGEIMLITDHIGLMAMVGHNPLWGPNDETLGPRFPAMGRAYDPELRRLALQVAERLGLALRQGIYAGLSGPAFETPAEVRFLRLIGADAVGMSTVPEVIAARHAGLRVLGLSLISNAAVADPDAHEDANHEEVLQAGQAALPALMALLRGVLTDLPVDQA